MNEVGLNAKWLHKDLTHEETQKFAAEVLNHMREKLSDYQEMYGDLYNLEATPAESTTFRFAKHDKEQYPEIITANENGTPYYTNSSHLPVGYTEDIFSALDVTHQVQYSTHFLVRSFLIGRQLLHLFVRLQRIIVFHTTHCHLHTQYVRITDTLLAKYMYVQTVERRQRCIAV